MRQRADGLTFYTIGDERYFPGVVALLNSLRLTGNDEPLVVLDAGLSPSQRSILQEHCAVVDPPPAALGRPAHLSKPYPHLLPDPGVPVLIDSDIIVTARLAPLLEPAAHGKVCAFADHRTARRRRFAEWEALLGLRAPVRDQTYVNGGLVAVSADNPSGLLGRWWDACGRVLPGRFGDQSHPFDAADQDVLNALLMSEVPADALEVLPNSLCVFWDELDQVDVVEPGSLRCTRDSEDVAVLHYSFGPKPWESLAWTRVRRDAFVRLLPRVLFGDDVALRMDAAEAPLWLRPSVRGRILLRVLDVVQGVGRGIVYALPAPVKDRLLRARRSFLQRRR